MVDFERDGSIVLSPKPPLSPKETHAALAIHTETMRRPVRDFQARVRFTNEAQLRRGRAGKPNEWEVFWLLFNYAGDGKGGKKANFLLVKPVGLEIGRAFGQTGQKFLYVSSAPLVEIGQEHLLRVSKAGQRLSVELDGKPAALFIGGADAASQLYDHPGAVGLYCEDARVRIREVVISPAGSER